MAVIPRFLLQHKVTVEALIGHSGTGPQYAGKVTVRCFVQNGQRLTRGTNEEQVTASATVRFRPDVACPVGSRITFSDGRTGIVLVAFQQEAGHLPAPAHLEVMTT